MPAKYKIKNFEQNGAYHIFNRGVEKRDIFLDDKDYKVFLYILKMYLLKKEDAEKGSNPFLEGSTLQKGRFYGEVELLCFCLMPNHFHLLVRQTGDEGLSEFMRGLLTNYVMYFNKRHDRVGSLFQGTYKAAPVLADEYLLHVSRYIHLNPKDLDLKASSYDYSSLHDYLGKRKTNWLNTDFILEMLSHNENKAYRNYFDFMASDKVDIKMIIGDISID
ncbi:MAG: putative transposase [candidate division CPR2 bacterium GW2011_GWC1_41_48]|uniref:Putative transposase n=1 Tax=candidate division CPR2 bacterium GW2011_GWC1_41_48 TaxID=1618344 RepID=A0A0G0WBS4_UNCC2|nr:MAG: putative transposase [candidate division CPR2 bacterium GW2011_GWC2_39_35]KKR29026.1 MAG: putative transposase [candidate division CPR2 bacterium GW2011_GWD2_39_7]KKS09522.1 MAG: putative transposase [candidate division CPR2 bacterium GW2011_GWC1_41_48]OGB70424.1 MAG: hypothetical protein A2Y26_00415 [candidate division CPR2 bacterium GWD2_39_7]